MANFRRFTPGERTSVLIDYEAASQITDCPAGSLVATQTTLPQLLLRTW